jgi:peroxiredoxin
LSELDKRGIRVAAISVDSVEVSRRLGEKAGLTFPLLADPEEKVIRPYDLLHIRGGPKGADIARPAEFLIDSSGTVRWVYLTESATVRARGEELVRAVDRLRLGVSP